MMSSGARNANDIIDIVGICFAGLVMRLRNAPTKGKDSQPATAGFGHGKYEIAPSELNIGAVLGSGNYGVCTCMQ